MRITPRDNIGIGFQLSPDGRAARIRLVNAATGESEAFQMDAEHLATVCREFLAMRIRDTSKREGDAR